MAGLPRRIIKVNIPPKNCVAVLTLPNDNLYFNITDLQFWLSDVRL